MPDPSPPPPSDAGAMTKAGPVPGADWAHYRRAEPGDDPDDPITLGCENGHVSHRYLKSEALRANVCLACHKPVFLIVKKENLTGQRMTAADKRNLEESCRELEFEGSTVRIRRDGLRDDMRLMLDEIDALRGERDHEKSRAEQAETERDKAIADARREKHNCEVMWDARDALAVERDTLKVDFAAFRAEMERLRQENAALIGFCIGQEFNDKGEPLSWVVDTHFHFNHFPTRDEAVAFLREQAGGVVAGLEAKGVSDV